jgi:ATP-dependent DNA helicase RecQ
MPMSGTDRHNLVESEDTRGALREIVRAVFAKNDLRDGQYEAIVQVLSGNDVTVLLPTGAGKSLIYQVAGLSQPGCTIVIDPLVALMQDQVFGLGRYGIDRAIEISRSTTQLGLTKPSLELIAQGEPHFVFVAPERLQMADFRQSLTSLTQITSVNLAVIDEAHYVSEWGHSFRTSYLALGNVLRKWCANSQGTAPPLAALTGTASRAVLKDTLFQLRMDTSLRNSIIKPASFDRPELSFSIINAPAEASSAALSGQLQGLPNKFPGANPVTFFQSTGDLNTNSGLVFVPTVNGKPGVADTRDLVREVTGADIGIFSGAAPKGFNRSGWDSEKTHYATQWKSNDLTALVATNAFGVGIDKPNVRWVIHHGIPSSMEAYYQEAGRAGRDGKDSECILILAQFDEEQNRRVLSTDLALEQVRRHKPKWNERDDVSTALYFHTLNFPGVEGETTQLQQTLSELSPGEVAKQRALPFATGSKDLNNDKAVELQSRAIYRLVILGIINDYTVDYGSKTYTINVAGVTPERVSRHLLEFVQRNQPQQLEQVRQQIGQSHRTIEEAIADGGRALIQFVYETIERSRRRSLREMWLAAVECRSGDELRSRILSYLNEGDSAPVLSDLVEDQAPLGEWVSMWQTITAEDADDWRGSSGQLLVSYPDNPGLLMTRGLTEALDPRGNLNEFELNVMDGVEKAFAGNIRATEIDTAVAAILEILHQMSTQSVAAARLVAKLEEQSVEIESATKYLEENWKHNPDLMVLYVANTLEKAIALTHELGGNR